MFGGMLVVQGLQSKFATHPYTFDSTKSATLKEDLSSLLANKESMQYKDLKDLLNMQLSFCLYSQDACY